MKGGLIIAFSGVGIVRGVVGVDGVVGVGGVSEGENYFRNVYALQIQLFRHANFSRMDARVITEVKTQISYVFCTWLTFALKQVMTLVLVQLLVLVLSLVLVLVYPRVLVLMKVLYRTPISKARYRERMQTKCISLLSQMLFDAIFRENGCLKLRARKWRRSREPFALTYEMTYVTVAGKAISQLLITESERKRKRTTE